MCFTEYFLDFCLYLVSRVTMADVGGAPHHRAAGNDQQIVGGRGGSLTEAQSRVLDRCLLALRHAKNDSHTLAALLLVSSLTSLVTVLTLMPLMQHWSQWCHSGVIGITVVSVSLLSLVLWLWLNLNCECDEPVLLV